MYILVCTVKRFNSIIAFFNLANIVTMEGYRRSDLRVGLERGGVTTFAAFSKISATRWKTGIRGMYVERSGRDRFPTAPLTRAEEKLPFHLASDFTKGDYYSRVDTNDTQ